MLTTTLIHVDQENYGCYVSKSFNKYVEKGEKRDDGGEDEAMHG